MWKRLVYLALVFTAATNPIRAQQRVSTLQLVSSISSGSQGAGVSAYRHFALTGIEATEGGITGSAVGIFDIEDPVHPVIVGRTPIYQNQFFENHRALRIGQRDVLVVLYAKSGYLAPSYLKLFDISNPALPLEIGSYQVAYAGVHFEIAIQGTRTLALVSSFRAEAGSSNFGQAPGTGDLLILDISDPTTPVQVGEWGVIDEPALGLEFYLNHQQGVLSRDYGEGVWASPDGRRAYYAYSDFGVMILDISNPSSPKFLGRVGYEPEDNGDAHQVRIARGGSILVRSSIVRWPFQTRVTSNVFDDVRSAGEDSNTPALYELPDHRLSGEVLAVGAGCDAGSYPAELEGKVALIEDTGCGSGGANAARKVVWAQERGAKGVIFHSPVKPGGFDDAHGKPGTGGRLNLGGGMLVPITIPVVAVGWKTGSCLAATAPVNVALESVWTGYGKIDIFDIRTPAAPVRLSSIGTEHTMDVNYELANRYPAPNPQRDVTANHMEIVGNTLYASFWADGLRVFDISQPASPKEIGAWRGEGRDPGDASMCAWQVVWHNSLVLLNSIHSGLYILK